LWVPTINCPAKILVEDGHLTNRDEERVEAFNAFFASGFNNTGGPWAAQSPESEHHKRGNTLICGQ